MQIKTGGEHSGSDFSKRNAILFVFMLFFREI